MFDGLWNSINSAFAQAFVVILSTLIVGTVMWIWRRVAKSNTPDNVQPSADTWSRNNLRMRGRANSETSVSYQDTEQFGKVKVVTTKESFIGGAVGWSVSKGEDTEMRLPGGAYISVGSGKNNKQDTEGRKS